MDRKHLETPKGGDQKIEMLVRWRGNPPCEDTWEPLSAVIGDQSPVLHDYCMANGLLMEESESGPESDPREGLEGIEWLARTDRIRL